MRLSLILIIVFARCAALAPDKKLIPTVVPERDTPTVTVGPIRVWADTKLPRLLPSDVEGWMAPVALDIENAGDVSVELRLEDFRLVDDKGRKTAPFFMPPIVSYPIDVDVLRENMRKNPPVMTESERNSYVFTLDNKRTAAMGAAAWRDEVGRQNPPGREWEEQVRFVGAPRGIALLALSDRMLEPRSRLTGYVFFARPYNDSDKAWLIWKLQGDEKAQVKIEFDLRAEPK